MTKPDYKKEVCHECGQSTTYLLALDRGTAIIVKAVAAAIKRKGINIIHPKKEMEVPIKEWSYSVAVPNGLLTSVQIGNMTRARVHGLIARIKGEPGNWCLTSKGAKFLRGEPVPRYAIIRKTRSGERSRKDDYYMPDTHTVTVNEIDTEGAKYWEPIGFDIVEGRVVEEVKLKKAEETQRALFV